MLDFDPSLFGQKLIGANIDLQMKQEFHGHRNIIFLLSLFAFLGMGSIEQLIIKVMCVSRIDISYENSWRFTKCHFIFQIEIDLPEFKEFGADCIQHGRWLFAFDCLIKPRSYPQ